MTGKRKLIKAAGTEKTKRTGRPKATKRDFGAGYFSMSTAERKAVIDRIITAGIKAAGRPPDDEKRLATDIELVIIQLGAFDLLDEVKAAGRRHKQAKRISRGMEKYVALINAGPAMGEAINVSAPDLLPRLLDVLERYEDSQARQAKEYRLKAPLPPDRRPTPIEYLAGVSLPLMYEKRFGFDIAFGRDDDRKPKGALVDFIEATIAELKLPYSRESIGSAISHLRTVRDNCRQNPSALGALQFGLDFMGSLYGGKI